MFILLTVVVVEMCGADARERRSVALEMPVTRVVTDADVWKLRDGLEFLDTFEGRDLVRDVFDQDLDPGKRTDLRDCRIGMLKRDGTELFSRIPEMQYHMGKR